jgi:hypothetical protein
MWTRKKKWGRVRRFGRTFYTIARKVGEQTRWSKPQETVHFSKEIGVKYTEEYIEAFKVCKRELLPWMKLNLRMKTNRGKINAMRNKMVAEQLRVNQRKVRVYQRKV